MNNKKLYELGTIHTPQTAPSVGDRVWARYSYYNSSATVVAHEVEGTMGWVVVRLDETPTEQREILLAPEEYVILKRT